MPATLVLVHGRAAKPSRRALRGLWVDALRAGLARDRPRLLPRFDDLHIEFVYFGDLSNAFLGVPVESRAQVRSRRATLTTLMELSREDFRSRTAYRRLPGRTALRELLADLAAGPAAALRVSEPLITTVAPDICEYWNADTQFGSDLRFRMMGPLRRAFDRGGSILVLAHSLGTMIAWDTLWKFSRAGEYRPRYTHRRIDTLITIGSPLGDTTVRRHLRGHAARGARRYPANVRRWHNLAARDDYIAHDQKITDDFRPMRRLGLTDELDDHRILNFAVREGRHNPHHSGGYLIHPDLTARLAAWLRRVRA